MELILPVYTYQVVVRGAFHNFLLRFGHIGEEKLKAQRDTDLVSHACCSQVVTLCVHHFTLAENVFVVDVWSLMFEVPRITPPYLTENYFVHVRRLGSSLFLRRCVDVHT